VNRNIVWSGITLAALACGFLLGRSGSSDGSPARGELATGRTTPAESPIVKSDQRQQPSDPVGNAAALADGAGRVWARVVGREPTEAERARIGQAADGLRARLRAQAERAEIGQAQRLADEYVEEQRRLEDAARGGTMQLLRSLAKAPVRLPRLVSDPKAFAVHFERKTTGPRLNGMSLPPNEPIADGATLEFPAGVHVLDTRRIFRRGRKFPKDLLIVGVGMDDTLLRIEEISTDDEVASLTFRNLTLDCNNDYMTDLRHDSPATIRLESCRVIGFDMGAGGSVMFAARTGAFYASDCRFEAGYSRTRAGFGNLFRVSRGLLVRMENCVFNGPFSSIFDGGSSATFHFEGCEIRDTKRLLGRCKTSSSNGVTFQDCSLIDLTGDTRSIRRSLADINPAWPKRKR